MFRILHFVLVTFMCNMSSVDGNNASFNQFINEVDSIDNNSNVLDWTRLCQKFNQRN